MVTSLLDKASSAPRALTHRELVELLTWPEADALFAAAYEVKRRDIGRAVSFRGLVEFGNMCEKDCYYCGI
ncbi:MAG: [Kiritimatiellae bacterium]|nr:[FeFe] hydrogenase H-cluster radical SAM maturase HydE [Kiritimatiellia bacterium]